MLSTSTTSKAAPGSRCLGRSFWRLWLAALVSGAGDGVRMGALPLLAASISRQPFAVAAVWFAGGVPFILVGPFTGVLTDRWHDKRRVMARCDIAAGVMVALFAALVALGATDVALLVGLNFALGSVETLRVNASVTIVPELVTDAQLDRANSRVQSAQMLTIDVLGPPAGALLMALPAGVPFLLDSASFAASAVLVCGVVVTAIAGAAVRAPAAAAPAPPAAQAPGPGGRPAMVHELTDGLKWLWAHRLLRRLCVLAGLSGMAVMVVMSIAVLYALEILHVGRDTYAVLLGLVASGGVAGALAAPILSGRIGRHATLRVAFALGPPAFIAAALTSSAAIAAPAMSCVGIAVGAVNVVTVSLRQSLVPADLRGRVNASYRLVAVGLTPVGAVLGGLLSQLWGLRAPFLAGAVIYAICLLASLRPAGPVTS